LSLLAEAEHFGLADRETRITELLGLLAADERAAWLAETVRLAKLLDRYDRTIPKRRRNATTRKLEFTAEVVGVPGEFLRKVTISCKSHQRNVLQTPNSCLFNPFEREGGTVTLLILVRDRILRPPP